MGQAGADYLAKPVDPNELIARVRRLIERPNASDQGEPEVSENSR